MKTRARAALALILFCVVSCGDDALVAPPGPEPVESAAPEAGSGGRGASSGRGGSAGAPAGGAYGRDGGGNAVGRGGTLGRDAGSGAAGAVGGRGAGAGAAGSSRSDGAGGAASSGGTSATDAGSGASAVLINEVVVDPQRDWNDSAGGNAVPFDAAPGNGPVTGSDEWIELYNAGNANVDLSGWTLIMTDGTPATEALGVDGAVLVFSARGSIAALAPGEYLVVGNPKGDLSNAVAVELRDAQGTLVDAVALGAEGAAPNGNATSAADEAIARTPNGADTGKDAADFSARPATPAAAN